MEQVTTKRILGKARIAGESLIKEVVELHEGGLKFPAGGDIHRQKGIK